MRSKNWVCRCFPTKQRDFPFSRLGDLGKPLVSSFFGCRYFITPGGSPFFARKGWFLKENPNLKRKKTIGVSWLRTPPYLVGGLVAMNLAFSHIHIGLHSSSQLTNSYFSEGWLKTTNQIWLAGKHVPKVWWFWMILPAESEGRHHHAAIAIGFFTGDQVAMKPYIKPYIKPIDQTILCQIQPDSTILLS